MGLVLGSVCETNRSEMIYNKARRSRCTKAGVPWYVVERARQGRRAAGASDDVVAVARGVSRVRDAGDAVYAPPHIRKAPLLPRNSICYHGRHPRTATRGADIYTYQLVVECARHTWLCGS